MRNSITLVTTTLVLVLLSSLFGCDSRTEKQETGGVILTISDFDGFPIQVSVNTTLLGSGLVQVGVFTLQNIATDPDAATSELMNVEIESYEVQFSRADRGTRLPPPLIRKLLGLAPVNGTETYNNLPILAREQMDEVPLSDLLFINGGFDKETGETIILLNLSIRFFGRTLSGDAVSTSALGFTIEFVP